MNDRVDLPRAKAQVSQGKKNYLGQTLLFLLFVSVIP